MTERCSKCILPVNLPGISLDETGKCNYCRSFEEKYMNVSRESTQALQSRFEKILDRFRGKGFYDCLVPVSGGKDSMYILYMMAKVYNMNVLAYNFNNGFQSSKAFENMERAVKNLGVEFIMYKPREDILFDLFRIFLTRAGEFCSPCNMLIGAAAKKLARQNGIPLVMMGYSERWSSGIKGMSVSGYCDRRYYLNVVEGCIDTKIAKRYVVKAPMANVFWRLTGKGPELIEVFEYLNPGMEKIQETLEKELGWESPSDELEHGDCLLNPIKDYIVYRRWGCSEVTGAYSALVRNGEMTREEALHRAEEAEIKEAPAVLEMFLEKIGLTRDDFEESLKRHFTDFPNFRNSTPYKVGQKALGVLSTLRGKR